MEEVSQDLTRPLSPVLSNLKKTRKLVRAKRPQKKSRVKLTDRFAETSSVISSNITLSGNEDQQSKPKISNEGNHNEVNTVESENHNVNAPNLVENKAPTQSEVCEPLTSETCSFKTAGGKNINFSSDKMKQSLQLLDDIINPKESIEGGRINKFSFISKRKNVSHYCHPKKIKLDHDVKTILLKQNQNVDVTFKPATTKNATTGFTTASGKGISISEAAYKKALKKVDDFKTEELNLFMNVQCKEKENAGDLLPSQETYEMFSNITVTESTLKKENCATQEEYEKTESCIESIQSNKKTLDSFTKHKTVNLMQTLNDFENKAYSKEDSCKVDASNSSLQFSTTSSFSGGFSTASGKNLIVSEESLKKAQRIFQLASDENIENSIKPLASKVKIIANEKNMPSSSGLGFQTAAGSKLKVSEENLRRAKDVFRNIEDLSFNNSTLSNLEESSTLVEENVSMKSDSHRKKKRTLGVRHCKPIEIAKHKIEKAKQLFKDEKLPMSPVESNSPAVPTFNSTPIRKNSSSLLIPNITPIKVEKPIKIEKPSLENISDHRFIIQECTKGNVDSWCLILENQKKLIEMKLEILKNQLLAENAKPESKKRRDGILFERKQKCKRLSLSEYLKPGNCPKILNINPKNAELVHFNCNQESVSFMGTLDGARVVPNMNNVIGLSEIEAALKATDGVDAKLMPQGWIRNHFKWIVWKLASYENFSNRESLTIENVVQQLKYRYDREIERAERSALRKIYEMDDSPQKRLVLCVSDIFNLQNGKFELELTDGWYSIRTVTDELLCKQVVLKKITVGTKLMTYGAELLNCEGCHPLEAVDAIRLKINYNSTRRVKWYVKLGYQKFSEPFPVKLESISPIGGVIGCIKVYVARKYPVKYMEKVKGHTIWRNKRAEELRAQEWENRRHQDLERLRESVNKQYESEFKNKSKNCSFNVNDIKNINCPETLWHLYENSRDPEKLEEILSSSQKNAIMDYKNRQSALQQQEIARKIQETMTKNKFPGRDVTPVLQLAILDALCPNDKGRVFQIWRPSDIHLDTLKEGSIFYIYNVLPKRNGDLCTMSRTRFQICCLESTEFQKYERTVVPIPTIFSVDFKPIFKEFDTVGIVVELAIDACSQRLWLADSTAKLLLIKIFQGPNNCLLLDRIKVGQVVAVSNLIFCRRVLDFGESIANESSVISCYPQQKHLQEEIQKLSADIPKDQKCLLEECRQKILYYSDHADITKSNSMAKSFSHCNNNSEIFDESSDDFYSSIDVDNLA